MGSQSGSRREPMPSAMTVEAERPNADIWYIHPPSCTATEPEGQRERDREAQMDSGKKKEQTEGGTEGWSGVVSGIAEGQTVKRAEE